MRFSILSLIAIITLTAFAIDLYSTYEELRKTRAELVEVSLMNDEYKALANANARSYERAVRDLPPFIEKQQTAYDARVTLQHRAEKLFHELVTQESSIDPQEGMISIREIPTITSVQRFHKAMAIHVPAHRHCEIELQYIDERAYFELEPKATFPLQSGRNEVVFSTTGEKTHSKLSLIINEQVVASASANDAFLTGYTESQSSFNPQRNFGPGKASDIPPLLDFQPVLKNKGIANTQPKILIRLVEVTSNE